MKCGFATIEVSALCFTAALPPLHASLVLALHIAFWRCFITKAKENAMKNDKLFVQSMDLISPFRFRCTFYKLFCPRSSTCRLSHRPSSYSKAGVRYHSPASIP